MNINKINIKCIAILSATILLLCIICAMLTLEQQNKTNTQNSTTNKITQTEKNTSKITQQTEAFTGTEAASVLTTAYPTSSSTKRKPIKQENIHTPSADISSNSTAPTANNSTEKTTEKATAITEATTTNDEELLNQILNHSGYTLNDLNNIQAEQLIVVTAYNSTNKTTAKLFSLNDNIWQNEKLDCTVNIGSNGIGIKTSNDDNITPKGLYTISEAFYIDQKPSTWLNTFKITSNTYWITDTSSDMYNKKIELENNENFNNAIHMISSPSYQYGCVINYNTNPIIKDKGSAIFMECGTSATNGSIAFTENDLLKYLEILNSEKNPAIVIF